MISATSSRVIISLSFSDKDRRTAPGFYDVADRLVTLGQQIGDVRLSVLVFRDSTHALLRQLQVTRSDVRSWMGIPSEDSLQKKTLTSYYLATGRYYPLMVGNNTLLPTISRHYPVLPR